MSRLKGQLAAAATGVQVGLALVATRALAGEVSPMTLALLRYGIGVSVLLPLFLRMRRARIASGDLVPILALGVGQFAVLVALLNAGLQSVTAAQGGVIFATFPLVTILLAAALGRERLTVLRGVGALISFTGVAVCLGATTLPSSPVGAALVFASACAGALCSIFYRPYLHRYPTLQIGTLAMAAATVTLIPGTLTEAPGAEMAALTVTDWGLVLFIGLASGAGYLLWLTALKHTDAGEATVLMGLSPVTATLVGALLLGEGVGPVFLLGLGLALLGVSLAVLSRG
ncbi:DMT family transporter [Marimonas sp. MJW-29]|uniref:DMT family transporter n=1 Tax=Sulfitobacter sediminis TaxID=3234186 RepID=A0ABV3RKF8_9RHOB